MSEVFIFSFKNHVVSLHRNQNDCGTFLCYLINHAYLFFRYATKQILMLLTSISNSSMGLIITALVILFIFIATRRWGVNWFTWILGLAGSMKKGFLVIIFLFLLFLITGYCLGYIAH